MTSEQSLLHSWSRLWAPPPKLTLSQWADRYRKLSTEASAEAGQWKTSRAEYQRGMLDAFTDPSVSTVVIMSAIQLAKTEVILNALGYVIDQDPGPTLLVVPRDSDGATFSKIRLSPMLRDTPCLRGKVAEARARDSGNTIDHKTFQGGHLRIAGSNSPANLASLPIRYLFCDEVDKFPLSAAAEGDPIALALGRTTNYWNRKVILTCSPTIEPTEDGGGSRIARAYLEGDQREYHVPCWRCGEYQVLHFDQVDQEAGLYRCLCRAYWEEAARIKSIAHGTWIAQQPFRGVASFRISSLYSPWMKLSDLVREHQEKKNDPERLKTFVNTRLAETWKEKGEAPEYRRLYDRCEDYPIGTVPLRGLFLTAGADVQKDRIEVEIVAWGRGKESWSVDVRILLGNPANEADPVWTQLDELLNETFEHETGARLPILRMAVDSGYATNQVYAWSRTRSKVIAVDGRPTGSVPVGMPSPVDVTVNGRKITRGLKIWPVATGLLKSELYGWLQMDGPTREQIAEGNGEYPPGYCHFPKYPEEFFKQLTAEHLIRRVHKGYPRLEWQLIGGRRNEALDRRIYARAAANVCGLDRFREKDWQILERQFGPPVESKAVVKEEEPEEEYIPQAEPAPAPAPSGAQQRSTKPTRPRVIPSPYL